MYWLSRLRTYGADIMIRIIGAPYMIAGSVALIIMVLVGIWRIIEGDIWTGFLYMLVGFILYERWRDIKPAEME